MASSEPRVFHPFPRFPAEIRRKIYLLATQPRFVHVQERLVSGSEPEDAFDDFRETLRTTLPQPGVTLHPSLAYFAHNWRRFLVSGRVTGGNWARRLRRPNPRGRLLQTTLDSFGFTTNRQVLRPWVASLDVPEVQLHWLDQQPELAWEFLRESELHSAAPIPPLLHTCAESREVLVEHGYQLAFGTRASPPRTWFCFKDDVLFLARGRLCYLDEPWGGESSPNLDGGTWNIGPFNPEDLRRVKRLALEGGCASADRMTELSKPLRLMPGVRELFAVAAGLNLSMDWPLCESREECKPWGNDLWGWVGWDEADVSDNLLRSSLDCYGWQVSGGILKYKKENGWNSDGYFESVARTVEDELREHRDRIVRSERATPWEIPKVKFVHLGSKKMIDKLFRQRDAYWLEMDRKERLEAERGVSPDGILGLCLLHFPPLAPPSNSSPAEADDVEEHYSSLFQCEHSHYGYDPEPFTEAWYNQLRYY